MRGPVVYLGAEDDQDEMHRRFAAIAREQEIELDRLGNIHILCLAGKNAVLASANVRDIVEPTPLWFELRRIVLEVRPKLVVYDTLADLFAGNENSRPQAQQFVSMLRGLALETDSTALLLAHPSLSGMSTGSGSSGSTAWSNSVRSRLYLDRVRDGSVEPDPDARVLRTMKMNYGRAGGEVRLRWHDGVFILDAGPETNLAQAAKIQHAETVFLDLLGAYNASGRFVTSTTGANYAPAAIRQRGARATHWQAAARNRHEPSLRGQAHPSWGVWAAEQAQEATGGGAVKAFQRPSNALPTGVQTGVPDALPTAYRRYSDGLPPHPPYPPGARRAPLGPLEGPGAPQRRSGRECSAVGVPNDDACPCHHKRLAAPHAR